MSKPWRTGLRGLSHPTLVIDLEGFAGNGLGDKFSDHWISAEFFRSREDEIPSEVVTPTDEG
jgi:hypothetical protein